MTVARVLRQPEKVAPKTRARVTKCARRTHYVPDLLARALASRHTGVVAAIVPTLANSLIAEVTQGMSEALARHGRQLMIGASNYSAATEEALVRSFLARRVDAIYLTGTSQTPATVRLLRAAGIPVVQGGNLPGARDRYRGRHLERGLGAADDRGADRHIRHRSRLYRRSRRRQ